MPKISSIAALRKALAAKEADLAKLVTQRNKLAVSLAKVDKKIATLGGVAAAAPAPKKKTQKKKARKGAKKGVKKGVKKATGGRRRGKTSLGSFIQKVLSQSADGMRVKDIAGAVVGAGYKSKSKDLYNGVAATLGADSRFKRVARGVYKTS